MEIHKFCDQIEIKIKGKVASYAIDDWEPRCRKIGKDFNFKDVTTN